MAKYICRRLLVLIPSFLGITVLSFLFINMAPGGPIEQKLRFIRYGGGNGGASSMGNSVITDAVMQELKHQYGFDKPVHVRYFIWLKNIAKLDFGKSTTFEEPVLDLITNRFPVSMQFGLASFLFSYILAVPLGLAMAIKSNSVLDRIVQSILFTLSSIPPLISGIVLIVIFAGASHFDLFPTGGLISDDYDKLSLGGKFLDRLHHFILPLIVYVIGSFTTHTMVMRNSMLEVLKQDYMRTARSKGLSEKIVYFKHGLRNALLPMVTGFGSFLSLFLSGSLIIESIFGIEGIGKLSYIALIERDYNLVMGLIFLSSVFLMLGRLMSDLLYTIVDPRIDFK